jgi:hypothetical protein
MPPFGDLSIPVVMSMHLLISMNAQKMTSIGATVRQLLQYAVTSGLLDEFLPLIISPSEFQKYCSVSFRFLFSFALSGYDVVLMLYIF